MVVLISCFFVFLIFCRYVHQTKFRRRDGAGVRAGGGGS